MREQDEKSREKGETRSGGGQGLPIEREPVYPKETREVRVGVIIVACKVTRWAADQTSGQLE